MKKTNSPKFGKIFRILAASGLACAISISGQFPASVAAQSTSVNSIPPECLDDNGVALTPDLSSGWLFLVNFNVPVLGGVRGCMVQSNASGQINRTGFMCSTMGSVDVANGNAVLNGAGYFSCPFDISKSAMGSAVSYNYYWMRARLQPSTSTTNGVQMPLFVHPSAELRATRDDYTVKMTSRLNTWSFISGTSGRFAKIPVKLDSTLNNGLVVSHWVNDVVGASTPYGHPVVFSTAPTTVQIGAIMTGSNVILSEIIVDPGGHCCY
ncbi:MAG TPA: hypothetical protein PL074_06520 [Thermoflexales bacterium]|nr:hypothetical protein [Thermoflexales bacterium]